MMEAIERTKAIIHEAQQTIDEALSKAQAELEEAKQRAHLELNAVAMDVDRTDKSANPSTLGSHPMTILALSTLIIGLSGFVVNESSVLLVNVFMKLIAESLSSSIDLIDAYPFSFRIAFFAAVMMYPILAVISHKRSRRIMKNVAMVDKACQTGEDVSSRAEGVIALSSQTKVKDERELEADQNSDWSDSSLSSLDDDDDDDDDDGSIESDGEEVVHFRVYVRLLRLVGSEWKKYGPLVMSLSRKSGKTCMVFRNDIGVIHLLLPIAKRMTFEKVEKKSAYIRFVSVEDENRGLECFMLQVSPKMLNKLHAKLVEMAT
ncbi:hypothetical protein HJC23_005731 [Cyclotella cryptica]|uniref:RanBD1 domain-containing protein n=1 Tax=Cyclotella cryptica TaxID=29204 RepID=A0ABD3QCQ7_9STRA|eukprot:CCRYP_006442-RA/>CCRYP_006442-RA protein AED:0.92 eAED:1.00 QI:0/-1/0/1/-1/1/1/0/318